MSRAAGGNCWVKIMAQLTGEVIAHLGGLHCDIRDQCPRGIERSSWFAQEISSNDSLQFSANLAITHAWNSFVEGADQFHACLCSGLGLRLGFLKCLFFFWSALYDSRGFTITTF